MISDTGGENYGERIRNDDSADLDAPVAMRQKPAIRLRAHDQGGARYR